MRRTMTAMVSDETGATATEYALIAALGAVAAIVGMTAVGVSLEALLDGIAGHIAAAMAAATAA
jgi:Flp pilus assembly pilin Flp